MTNTKKFRTIFFGSLEASADVLSDLHDQDWLEIVAVVSQPHKEQAHTTHRDTPVTRLARELGLRVFTPRSLNPDFVAELGALKADVGVLFAYGKILPDNLLEIFPHHIVNIHPSLLPKHRGPAPLEATILSGDTTAGTSIMLITSDMDAGPILASEAFEISATISKIDLWSKLLSTSRKLLIPTLRDYLAGNITPQDQSTHQAPSYSHIIKKTDGDIDTTKMSAPMIERTVRAYKNWPGTRLHVMRNDSQAILTLHDVSVIESHTTDSPSLRCEKGNLVLQTIQGSIAIDRAQLPGHQIISGRDLCNQAKWSLTKPSSLG